MEGTDRVMPPIVSSRMPYTKQNQKHILRISLITNPKEPPRTDSGYIGDKYVNIHVGKRPIYGRMVIYAWTFSRKWKLYGW